MNLYLLSDAFKYWLYDHNPRKALKIDMLSYSDQAELFKNVGMAIKKVHDVDDDIYQKICDITPEQNMALFIAISEGRVQYASVAAALEIFKEELNCELEAYWESIRDE